MERLPVVKHKEFRKYHKGCWVAGSGTSWQRTLNLTDITIYCTPNYKANTVFSCTAFLLTVTGRKSGQRDPLRFEVLMDEQMLKTINPRTGIRHSMDITSERHVLLSTKDQFFLLGWGGITPLGKSVSSGSIRSFAFSPTAS